MSKESRKKVRISELNFKNIGDRITFIRMMHGKTIEEFSAMLGISKGNLSDLENNKNKPSYDVIARITESFSINSQWVVSGTGKLFKRLDFIESEPADSTQDKSDLNCNFEQRDLAERILNEAAALEKISPTALLEVADYISGKLKVLMEYGERRFSQRRENNDTGETSNGENRRSGKERRRHDLYRV